MFEPEIVRDDMRQVFAATDRRGAWRDRAPRPAGEDAPKPRTKPPVVRRRAILLTVVILIVAIVPLLVATGHLRIGDWSRRVGIAATEPARRTAPVNDTPTVPPPPVAAYAVTIPKPGEVAATAPPRWRWHGRYRRHPSASRLRADDIAQDALVTKRLNENAIAALQAHPGRP